MKTLFLGAYGFGNIGDELCLIEAINSFPSEEVWVRTVSKDHTSRMVKCDGFLKWHPARPKKNYKINFDRVVLGGGSLLRGSTGKDYMNWIIAAQNSGVKTHIHNIGVSSGDSRWITWDIREAFKKLDGFTVRDNISLERVKKWGVRDDVQTTGFLEKNVLKDMSLANSLTSGNILGISIDNRDDIVEAILKNRKNVKVMINDIIGDRGAQIKILPVISTIHAFSRRNDDVAAFRRFYNEFLHGFEIIFPQTLDKDWWHNNMTPQKLKGLISKCDALISTRKHNCIHALSCGVKTIGVSLTQNKDGGISAVFDCFKETLPRGSGLFLLEGNATGKGFLNDDILLKRLLLRLKN